jgi:hypothetical protein
MESIASSPNDCGSDREVALASNSIKRELVVILPFSRARRDGAAFESSFDRWLIVKKTVVRIRLRTELTAPGQMVA